MSTSGMELKCETCPGVPVALTLLIPPSNCMCRPCGSPSPLSTGMVMRLLKCVSWSCDTYTFSGNVMPVAGSSQYCGSTVWLPDSVMSSLLARSASVMPVACPKVRLPCTNRVGVFMVCWITPSAAPGTLRRRFTSRRA